jgi:hypothetical protein
MMMMMMSELLFLPSLRRVDLVTKHRRPNRICCGNLQWWQQPNQNPLLNRNHDQRVKSVLMETQEDRQFIYYYTTLLQ